MHEEVLDQQITHAPNVHRVDSDFESAKFSSNIRLILTKNLVNVHVLQMNEDFLWPFLLIMITT